MRVPPSIKFIKRFYPNAELAKEQKKTAVVPEVVFAQVDETPGPKILSKREVLHLRNEIISKNRVDAHTDAYLLGGEQLSSRNQKSARSQS